MSQLERLPTEILANIGRSSHRLRDSASLALASQRCHAVVERELYRLSAEWQVDVIDWAIRKGSLKTLEKLAAALTREQLRSRLLTRPTPWEDSPPPLLKAIKAGSLEIVKFLVRHGSDINATGHPSLLLQARKFSQVLEAISH